MCGALRPREQEMSTLVYPRRTTAVQLKYIGDGSNY